MSIIIQNITEKRGVGQYGRGTQLYQLRINDKVIAEFTHVFNEGLGTCLRLAADAAENPQRIEQQDDDRLIMAILAHGLKR